MLKLNYFIIPLITFGTGFFGKLVSDEGMEWYRTTMIKPSYLPPKIAFPIAWNIIFALTAIAAIYVWNRLQHVESFRLIIGLFLVNPVLNFFWSFLFFNQRMIGVSVIDAVLLWATVIALIVLIWPHQKWVALLLAPYALWVSFAIVLNAHIWLLN